jgi:hypothetical protein
MQQVHCSSKEIPSTRTSTTWQHTFSRLLQAAGSSLSAQLHHTQSNPSASSTLTSSGCLSWCFQVPGSSSDQWPGCPSTPTHAPSSLHTLALQSPAAHTRNAGLAAPGPCTSMLLLHLPPLLPLPSLTLCPGSAQSMQLMPALCARHTASCTTSCASCWDSAAVGTLAAGGRCSSAAARGARSHNLTKPAESPVTWQATHHERPPLLSMMDVPDQSLALAYCILRKQP